jgi:hypothetical protein
VELFAATESERFYVIHINEVIGVLRYRDLFKPPGRLAFLALALELEDQALKLCQSASFAESCWLSLSEKRRQNAVELHKQRHGSELLQRDKRQPIRALIACTNLVDKAQMLWKQKLIDGSGFIRTSRECGQIST